MRSSGGQGPMLIAIACVVGVIALVVVLTSGKKGDDNDSGGGTTIVRHGTSGPGEYQPPAPPPYPPVTEALRQRAKDVVLEARELAQEGETIYKDAGKAHSAGNDDLWQAKLDEAAGIFLGIQDLWNELIAEMPYNEHYDQEQVANHYFGREGGIIQKLTKKLHDINKDRRLN